jgi:hypothetical protein
MILQLYILYLITEPQRHLEATWTPFKPITNFVLQYTLLVKIWQYR